jgi:hypothetical protein
VRRGITAAERDDARPLGQPPGRLGPLACVARQAVQQQDGPTVAAEVESRETNPSRSIAARTPPLVLVTTRLSGPDIRSADIHDATVSGADVADGSLTNVHIANSSLSTQTAKRADTAARAAIATSAGTANSAENADKLERLER